MHVSADLSGYLDGELAPAERARVGAHLETCGRCAAQLADLRATATLIAALPGAQPSRSLVPKVATRWNWLRPIRSLSSVASGAFLMVFLIASVAQSGSDLGGGPLTPFTRFAPTAAQPAGGPAAAPAAPTQTAGAEAVELKIAATPSAVPAPERNVASPAVDVTTQFGVQTAAPTGAATAAAEDRARGAQEDAAIQRTLGQRSEPPSPLIWLVLALIAGLLALTAHWRLRAA
jgi:anti-sigma factor RsiW